MGGLGFRKRDVALGGYPVGLFDGSRSGGDTRLAGGGASAVARRGPGRGSAHLLARLTSIADEAGPRSALAMRCTQYGAVPGDGGHEKLALAKLS